MTKEQYIKLEIDQRYKVDSITGCWTWFFTINRDGYGVFRRLGERLAHRVAYKVYCGPIPRGKIICHTCNNKRCINPNHIYAGTNRDNSRDRFRDAGLMTRTHCIYGHELNEANTFLSKIGCKMCIRCREIKNENR